MGPGAHSRLVTVQRLAAAAWQEAHKQALQLAEPLFAEPLAAPLQAPPSLPTLVKAMQSAIAELGGAVVPKLTWSCPKVGGDKEKAPLPSQCAQPEARHAALTGPLPRLPALSRAVHAKVARSPSLNPRSARPAHSALRRMQCG